MVVFDHHEYLTEEERRLKEDRHRKRYWKKWGPYVAERQWATGMFFFLAIDSIALITGQPQSERTTAPTAMLGVVSETLPATLAVPGENTDNKGLQ
jgi:hypothetical protein